MPPTFGQLIAQARKAAGLSQRELAADIAVQREMLSRWECDHLTIPPPAVELERLCTRLPELTQLDLLEGLGFNLHPEPLDLTKQEEQLITNFRRLPAEYRRLFIVIIKASARAKDPA